MRAKNGIYYEWVGNPNGEVLVLSNSLGTNLSMWNSQIEKLGHYFRLLRYDTRGHGQSDTPSGPYSIKDLAQDVVFLLEELKVEKAWFCGISIGGITGMKLATLYPDNFQGLILANTSARISTPEVWQKRIELIRNEGLTPVAAGTASRWFTEKFVETHMTIVNPMIDYLKSMNQDGYIACCQALVQENLWRDIEKIQLPTLLIAGQADQVCTVDEARKMNEVIRGSKIKILSGSHLSNIENAEEFSQSILDFTRRQL